MSWLMQGDCLERLAEVPDGSVDMVFADLPYGVTANKWDMPIDLTALWKHLLRVGKPRAAFVFTATQPFETTLICSQKTLFRYDLIWEKTHCSNPFQAKYRPLSQHESVCVFGSGRGVYNAQKVMRETGRKGDSFLRSGKNGMSFRGKDINDKKSPATTYSYNSLRNPKSVLRFALGARQFSIHPAQKPVALLDWLIRTYSNEGETVLDPTMGSGTTGVTCAQTGRCFIGIEKDATYFAAAKKRIKKAESEAS